MDLVTHIHEIHNPEVLSPSTSPANTIFKSHFHYSHTNFPIIAIAVIGILATAFLLASYYIIVIKCCLHWHQIDILRRMSLSRRQEETSMIYSLGGEPRGLDEEVIRHIPVIPFKKEAKRDCGEGSFSECPVCLNEFQEDEKLRVIPNCCHLFHIDCIDVWLQNNANCPLCRTSISTNKFETHKVLSPSSSPQDPFPCDGNEDSFVIEVSDDSNTNHEFLGAQEILNCRELEQRSEQNKASKFHKFTSMGDDCIHIRAKDDQFSIQPIRRSFSMDSSRNRMGSLGSSGGHLATREQAGQCN